jgi:hypothetical protein
MIPSLDPVSVQPPEMTLAAAATMGILASLHVCALVRLPIQVAYVTGAGASTGRVLWLTALFAAGLVGGTVVLGLMATPSAEGVQGTVLVSKYLFWILGACLIVAGVLLAGLIEPQLAPARWRGLCARLTQTDAPGALLLGVIFGLLQTPACPTCRGELLAVLGAGPGHSFSGPSVILLVAFAAAQSLVPLGTGLLAGVLRPSVFAWLRPRMCSLEQRVRFLAGNLLVVLGLYFVIVG